MNTNGDHSFEHLLRLNLAKGRPCSFLYQRKEYDHA